MISEEKFEELINLSIDREISPEDHELLKDAIRNDPDRRKTYQLYRNIHRASLRALRVADRDSMRVGSRRNLVHFFTNASLAAACVALGFVILSPFAGTSPVRTKFTEEPAVRTGISEPAAEYIIADSAGGTPALLAQPNDFSEYRASLTDGDPLRSEDAIVIQMKGLRDIQADFHPLGVRDRTFQAFDGAADAGTARRVILEQRSGNTFGSDLASFTFYR